MATYSLDDIRAAADKKYASVEIEFGDGDSVSLLNPVRLSKSLRNKLVKVQEALTDANDKDSDLDQGELLEDAIRIVADDSAAAERLIEAVGGDLAILVSLFQNYTDGTQAGEA